MDIRDEIKSILKEVFLDEATPSIHFKERIFQRLSNTLYTRPVFDYSSVVSQIDLIKKTNFNPDESFAIFIKSFGTTFVSKDPVTGRPSVGDELWAVVRDNEITTIFFRNSHQKDVKVSNVDHSIKISTLIANYNSSEKNSDGTVDFEVKKWRPQTSAGRKRLTLDLPIIDISGDKWYIDEKNEELIYSKNIKKKLSFDDLKEEVLEMVINAVTA